MLSKLHAMQPSHCPSRFSLFRCAVFLSFLLLLVFAQSAFATDWFVDGARGSDNNTGKSSYAPFYNVWKAWSMVQPGDTINLLPTVTYGPIYLANKSGTSTQYITIQGANGPSNLTKVSGQGKNFGIFLQRNVNYVVIKNLDITAPGSGNYSAWSGIFLQQNHHVQILNNYVHDAGCTGIQTTSSDYVTISWNRVSNNSKLTTNNIFCSGISTHENLDSDGSAGIKMRITNNIVHGNTNIPLVNCSAPCTDSDGNGIIIDDSRRTQTDYKAYRGGTLVQNNVVFDNGGRGLAIFYSDNVTVLTNTFYQNNQDPHEGAWRPGEIGVSYSGGIAIYNNILYSDGLVGSSATGAHTSISIQDCVSGQPIIFDNNLMYNRQNIPQFQTFFRNNSVGVQYGMGNKWGDPQFKNPSTTPSVADFRVLVGSPAVGFTSPSFTYPGTDILGSSRSYPVTVGAYQLAI